MIVQLVEKESYFLLKKIKDHSVNLTDDKENLNCLKLFIIKKVL